MNDDDLRERLTKALDDHRIVSFSRDGVRCECAQDPTFALMQWEEHRRHVADALMPVVREAINEARAEAIDCLALELDYPADAQLAAKRAEYWREAGQ